MKKFLCAALLCLLFCGGCEKKKTETQAPQADTSQQPYGVAAQRSARGEYVSKPAVSIDRMIDYWANNRKDDAAAMFLELDWESPALYSGHPVLSLSENDFLNLATDQQQDIGQQAISLGKDIREITRYIIEQAKTAKAENNVDRSGYYERALIRFADSLDNNDRLLVVQQIGKAVKGFARQELGEL